jgi:nucleoside-diphosphate-sugar epimerase
LKYLVTGGGGFIGSHIVQALLAQGAGVRVLDNFSTGKRENLAGLQGSLEILEGDLRNPLEVEAAVRDVDVIFHQGAFVSVPASLEDPQACFDVNVRGTFGLFEAARSAGVRRVVIASSAAVYGDSEALPLDEGVDPCPLSPYAASKQVAEAYAALYTRAFGLEVVALRYFNVYGPRQSPDTQYAAVVPIFIRQLLSGQPATVFGDGGQTRDLIYVQDVVRANLLAAEHPRIPGQIFNICSGQEINLLDLLEVLFELLPGAPEPIFSAPRPGDIYRSVGNPERAAQFMDFRAQVSLEQGLKETVEWLRN